MSKKATDVISEYGLDSEAALDAIVAFWDRDVVCELLCEAIDRRDDGKDFEEFIEDNHGESNQYCICDTQLGDSAKCQWNEILIGRNQTTSDEEFLRSLSELDESGDTMCSPPSPKVSAEERIGFWRWMSAFNQGGW